MNNGGLRNLSRVLEWMVEVRIQNCIALGSRARTYPQHNQFNSVSQSCLTLCYPMDCSMPSLPVHHQFTEFTQTHVIESVMPSNHIILCCLLLLPPSIFHSIRVFFQWVSSSHQVAKVLEFQLQHQSFQWIFRTAFL